MPSSWDQVLDNMACQIDLQERAILYGQDAPTDLDVDPPTGPLRQTERLRALELFQRCEQLLDAVTARAAEARSVPKSPYGSRL